MIDKSPNIIALNFVCSENLPISTFDEFVRVDTLLKTGGLNKKFFMEELMPVNGSDPALMTKRIMKKVFSIGFLKKVSWEGTTTKHRFSKCKTFHDVIVAAVMTSFPKITRYGKFNSILELVDQSLRTRMRNAVDPKESANTSNVDEQS